ncbi:MAG: hypothetical protein AAGG01_17720 [Planctomycetota bacterium]
MNRRTLLQSATALGALPSLARGRATPNDAEEDLARATRVLSAAKAIGLGGGYDRSWKSSGCPVEIRHGGRRILAASDQGTYCCGYTFAVAMAALASADALGELSVDDVRGFQKTWFGATAIKDEQERQCSVAVGQLKVGKSVSAEEAMAGDFLQLWRKTKKPAGHSVLFLGWVEVAERPIGISYLSSQGSTDGIGYAVEYFADAGIDGGRVDRDRLYFARLA